MTFTLGPSSLKHLIGVHPDLVRVVKAAIADPELTQDFTVMQGLRTLAEQRIAVAAGNSKTMKSRHLGGFAVDLVPWVNGAAMWEWGRIYPIACAMRRAGIGCGVPLRWGGVWDRRLSDLPDTPALLEVSVENYQIRHPGKDFLDGPHYELPIEVYPNG